MGKYNEKVVIIEENPKIKILKLKPNSNSLRLMQSVLKKLLFHQ